MVTIESNVNSGNIAEIPEIGNFTKILFYLRNNNINWKYFNYLKEITTLSDEIISAWLNINSKTLRAYRKPESVSKENIKEHLVLLISLYEHGIDVFETKENFDKWLLTNNYFLDNKPPKDFLDTVSGIKFIDDQLTAIEYGDNV
ncbi:MAG: MbcA/ParS/Xre antitoxin family protein [Lutibacter sp.]